jgi:hypothetical protein
MPPALLPLASSDRGRRAAASTEGLDSRASMKSGPIGAMAVGRRAATIIVACWGQRCCLVALLHGASRQYDEHR